MYLYHDILVCESAMCHWCTEISERSDSVTYLSMETRVQSVGKFSTATNFVVWLAVMSHLHRVEISLGCWQCFETILYSTYL
jgi:hypothetical protein